jgi:hypothetical protein
MFFSDWHVSRQSQLEAKADVDAVGISVAHELQNPLPSHRKIMTLAMRLESLWQ